MTQTSTQSLGEAEVEVCYEHIPGQPAGRRGSSTDGPAIADDVIVTGVMINGWEVDRSLFAPALVEKWEALIFEQVLNAGGYSDEQDGYETDAAGTFRG